MPTDSPLVQHELIPFGGSITREQFSLVQRLMLPWWGSMRVTAIWIAIGALFVGFDTYAATDTLMALLFSLFWGAGMFVFIWGLTTFARRLQWRQVEETHQEITGCIGEAGLEWNTSLTTAKFPWSKIVKIRQHPEMLLIFYNARCAFYMPKRFFATETAWNEANALALRQLPTKPKRSRHG